MSTRLKRVCRREDKKSGGNGGDEEDQSTKKIKQDVSPSNFKCDLCGKGPDSPRFKEGEVRELTETESSIVLYEREVQAWILCLRHYKSAVQRFLNRAENKVCCNIFAKHKSPSKTRLQEVSVLLAADTKEFTQKKIVPGQKICERVCLPLLNELIDSGKLKQTFPDPTQVDDVQTSVEEPEYSIPEDPRQRCDDIFRSMDLSPPRHNNQSGDDLDRKVEQLSSAIRSKYDPEGKFKKSNDFAEFIKNLRENHHEMSKSEKARIIRMLPLSWSSKQISEETGIPEKFINDARNEKLCFNRKERSDKMSPELKEKIIQFYLSDRISKIMPGTTISVKGPDGKRELLHKQLLFSSLYETHAQFLEKHPDEQVSLSQFRKLRPGNVVLVGAPGTHETCKVKVL